VEVIELLDDHWEGAHEPPDVLSAPRRRKDVDTDMDITPMIDITFLLLIFFLVASRIDDNAVVKLPTARHGTSVTVADSAVLTVVPAGDGVSVYMGQQIDEAMKLQAADIASQNEQITDFVQRELHGDLPKQQVLIRAAKQVLHREVSRILSAAGQVDGAEVYIAVMEDA
jgi:biopolymer transport protein ExbD